MTARLFTLACFPAGIDESCLADRLLDVSDRIPFRAVRCASSKVSSRLVSTTRLVSGQRSFVMNRNRPATGVVTRDAQEKQTTLILPCIRPEDGACHERACAHLIAFMRQIWRKFEKKAKQSRTVKDVMKETRWFSAQLKSAVTTRAWSDTGRSKDWEEQCRKCKGLNQCKSIPPSKAG